MYLWNISPRPTLLLPPLPTISHPAPPHSRPSQSSLFVHIINSRTITCAFRETAQAPVKRLLPSMAPTPEAFLPADLTTRVQITAEGKRRKTAVDLEKCSLRKLVQYNCDMNGEDIVCVPIQRWFRR